MSGSDALARGELPDPVEVIEPRARASAPVPRRTPVPTPARIMELTRGYWATKTLFSAVELGVFAALADGPATAEELRDRLGLHPRAARDFFDTLVALGMLDRDQHGYRNTVETGLFLDPARPTYMGGLLELQNTRSYPLWASLTEGLRTGQPQNGAEAQDMFTALYAHPESLREFLAAMSGVSLGPATALADKFPWDQHQVFCDLGAAQGMVPAQLALHHTHLRGIGFDLPPVGPVFEEFIAGRGLSDRVSFHGGDFFTDPLPAADVYVLGRILHDWGLPARRLLLSRVYDALPDGGALIVYDTIIDDERRVNAVGLMMSLNMLLETQDGADYTGADCQGWLAEAGFRESYVRYLVGAESMVVGRK